MCRLLKFSVDKLLFTVSNACLNIASGNLLALSHAMLNILHHANNLPDTAL